MFRKWLVEWIRENQFDRVVIATSSSAEERLDKQLAGLETHNTISAKLHNKAVQIIYANK